MHHSRRTEEDDGGPPDGGSGADQRLSWSAHGLRDTTGKTGTYRYMAPEVRGTRMAHARRETRGVDALLEPRGAPDGLSSRPARGRTFVVIVVLVRGVGAGRRPPFVRAGRRPWPALAQAFLGQTPPTAYRRLIHDPRG